MAHPGQFIDERPVPVPTHHVGVSGVVDRVAPRDERGEDHRKDHLQHLCPLDSDRRRLIGTPAGRALLGTGGNSGMCPQFDSLEFKTHEAADE